MCLASCGRRIDARDRGGKGESRAQGAAEVTSATAERNTASPVRGSTEQGDLLRHVDAQSLFSIVRGLNQKGVVLNVWATWCGPCRDELPMLSKLAKAYQGRGVVVLPLSVDDEESEGKIASALREFGFAPPYYIAKPPLSDMKAALHRDWPGNIPVTFLFDGTARRRFFFNTEVYEEELRPKLDALLNGTLTDGETSHGLIPGLTL